jgi:hypothetical protein
MSRPAQVGWMRGEEFVTASAALKDVSFSGISALVDVALPTSATVWVLLQDHPASRWVKAVVVEVKRVRRMLTYRRSPYLIRMRFRTAHPYASIRAAVGEPGARAGAPGREQVAAGAGR